MRAESASSSASSNRAAARDRCSRSTSSASSSSDAIGRDGLGRPDEDRQRRHRQRLDPLLAKRGDRQRARALRQPLPARIGQQIVMPEARRGARERLEYLDLHRGVGDVVLAANDVSHSELDIVDHRRERVEIAPVLAPQDRIGQRGAVDMALAPHQIVPAHGLRFELEPPVRPAAGGLEQRRGPRRSAAAPRGRRPADGRAPAGACDGGRVPPPSHRPDRVGLGL